MRWEVEAPAFAGIPGLDVALDSNGAGAAGAKAFAVEPPGVAVMWRQAGPQEDVTEALAFVTFDRFVFEGNCRHEGRVEAARGVDRDGRLAGLF